ncbi:RluA family pseudouridine synthase [Elusimicrobiota bacterium]
MKEDIPVIFEDENLLVVNKPAGMLIIPGRGSLKDAPSLTAIMTQKLQSRLYIVHRIDKETSGLVLLAKTPEIHRILCLKLEAKKIDRTYIALVRGGMQKPSGTLNGPIHKFGSGRMGIDKRGKPSATFYKVINRFAHSTLIEVEPRTSRRHQIRVHLYSIGHPVVGDPLYGNRARSAAIAPRLMLHAWKISIASLQGKPVRLETAIPYEFSIQINSME